jgi:AbrB family looped-hinge helix DNA binding protein
MALTTLTSKGQVTIPKSIRDSLNLSPGDKVEFVITKSNEVILRPITKKVDDVFGLLSAYQKDKAVSVEEMDEAIKQKLKSEF